MQACTLNSNRYQLANDRMTTIKSYHVPSAYTGVVFSRGK